MVYVAEHFRVSVGVVYYWIERDILPAGRLSGYAHVAPAEPGTRRTSHVELVPTVAHQVLFVFGRGHSVHAYLPLLASALVRC